MKLSEFNYHLPPELIAQEPIEPRDHSNLLILEGKAGRMRYAKFYEINKFLDVNDVLVLNDTKVIPARLLGKKETGGKQELLLLRPFNGQLQIEDWPNTWLVISKSLPKIGQEIIFSERLTGKIIQISAGKPVIEFNQQGRDLEKSIYSLGQMPLPPYIKHPTKRSFKEYQTVYAQKKGSVAAPTAGFHFTNDLLKKLKDKRIQMEYITLHVGLGTFEPVRNENIEKHQMHSEYFAINRKTADNLNRAKKQGKKIVAVGTTAARALEFATNKNGLLQAVRGWNNLFIIPGYEFKFVDKLITNFHLPKSTLLMLVCAFATKKLIFQAYRQAIGKKFRFYSFGDAMFII